MSRLGVQEGVDVYAFRVVREVCETAVTGEDDDEPEEVDPWRGVDACEEEFEEREGGIEAVFRDVGPEREAGCEA